MKKTLALLMLLAGAALAAKDVAIAENGQAKADIVVPPQPSVYVKFAAEELKSYLDKITGGDFKITSHPTAPTRVHLGRSPEADAAGLNPDGLERDGFFLSSKGDDLYIVGRDNPAAKELNLFHLFFDETDRGTLLGVYEFLERLGVRWPAPGPANECVPRKTTLSFPEGTRKVEPFFQERQNISAWDFMSVNPDAKEYCRDIKDVFLWGLRLKLSGRHLVVGCHTEGALKLQELWTAHPERSALINGKRNPNYSCWTDPAVVELWKRAADSYFSGGTPADAGLPHLKPYLFSSWPCPFISQDDFMIDPMDHYTGCDGRCRCERCEAFRKKHPCADDSELIWTAIAAVAADVKTKHPGKFISTLVYPPKQQIPQTVKLPDNVRVRLCVSGPKEMPTPKRHLAEDVAKIKAWSTFLGDNKPPLWTYHNEATHMRKLPGLPEIYPHLVANFLQLLREDISGMFMQSDAPTHTYANLDVYISARLLWNPNLDVDQELSDYYQSYYGPAAEPARQLFQRFEENWIKYWKLANPDQPQSSGTVGLAAPAKELQRLVWTKVYTPEEMERVDAMVAAVEKAAAADPIYVNRAGLLRPWILDIMKEERSYLMDKEERRAKIVALAPSVNAEPTASDWRSAPVHQLISATRLKPQLAAGGKFQLLRSTDTLYLRAELEEPKLSGSLTKQDRPRGDNEIWKDNDLEIFLYSCGKKELWQFIVNDQGNWALRWLGPEGDKWRPLEGFQARSGPISGGWLAEAAIPLEQLGPGELRFNLTRNRQVKGATAELSTWSPLAMVGNWHDPDNYGTLTGN